MRSMKSTSNNFKISVSDSSGEVLALLRQLDMLYKQILDILWLVQHGEILFSSTSFRQWSPNPNARQLKEVLMMSGTDTATSWNDVDTEITKKKLDCSRVEASAICPRRSSKVECTGIVPPTLERNQETKEGEIWDRAKKYRDKESCKFGARA